MAAAYAILRMKGQLQPQQRDSLFPFLQRLWHCLVLLDCLPGIAMEHAQAPAVQSRRNKSSTYQSVYSSFLVIWADMRKEG